LLKTQAGLAASDGPKRGDPAWLSIGHG